MMNSILFDPGASSITKQWLALKTLRPRQNGCHFTVVIFKYISFNENVWISIKSSLIFSKGPIHNIPSLVQMMAWRRPGDKPLSEQMLVGLLAHMCMYASLGLKELMAWILFVALSNGICYTGVMCSVGLMCSIYTLYVFKYPSHVWWRNWPHLAIPWAM